MRIAQIIVSLILVALVIIQERSSGLSGVFGGGGSAPYQTRRGMEKFIYFATIAVGVIFVVLAVLNLVV
ncbi:MAG: preprotein translocase subunit SecG [Patescibacteria group bacterium]